MVKRSLWSLQAFGSIPALRTQWWTFFIFLHVWCGKLTWPISIEPFLSCCSQQLLLCNRQINLLSFHEVNFLLVWKSVRLKMQCFSAILFEKVFFSLFQFLFIKLIISVVSAARVETFHHHCLECEFWGISGVFWLTISQFLIPFPTTTQPTQSPLSWATWITQSTLFYLIIPNNVCTIT